MSISYLDKNFAITSPLTAESLSRLRDAVLPPSSAIAPTEILATSQRSP